MTDGHYVDLPKRFRVSMPYPNRSGYNGRPTSDSLAGLPLFLASVVVRLRHVDCRMATFLIEELDAYNGIVSTS